MTWVAALVSRGLSWGNTAKASGFLILFSGVWLLWVVWCFACLVCLGGCCVVWWVVWCLWVTEVGLVVSCLVAFRCPLN